VDVEGMARYFAARSEVVAAYLFGSVAKGTARPQSDVDVAVLFDARLDPFERTDRYLSMLGALSDFVRGELDVQTLNQASPFFCSQVVKYGRVIYERTRAERIAFEVRTMAHFADTKPMRDFFTQVLYRRIREGKFGERTRRHDSSALEVARQLYGRITASAADRV
jgi:predicted nucleotidyltransferase